MRNRVFLAVVILAVSMLSGCGRELAFKELNIPRYGVWGFPMELSVAVTKSGAAIEYIWASTSGKFGHSIYGKTSATGNPVTWWCSAGDGEITVLATNSTGETIQAKLPISVITPPAGIGYWGWNGENGVEDFWFNCSNLSPKTITEITVLVAFTDENDQLVKGKNHSPYMSVVFKSIQIPGYTAIHLEKTLPSKIAADRPHIMPYRIKYADGSTWSMENPR